MLALLGDAEDHGACLSVGTEVVGADVRNNRIVLNTQDIDLECRELVNCAGLGAPDLAASFMGMPKERVPRPHWAKGNYYAFTGPSPFRRLVYPVPEAAGLGVHATVDLSGSCRFGPDVQWITPEPDGSLDFAVDPARAQSFYAEVRKYWPALPDGSLVPDYAGVRPKIQAPGEPARDFVVQSASEHGVPGLLNFFGIESPGLTSCLYLADHARSLLDRAS